MALFDALIHELDQRFGLGGQAHALVAQALAFITDPAQGGVSGFIRHFRDADLGAVAASWITKVHPGLPLTPAQLDAALGSDFSAGIAKRLGLAPETAREALAVAVPQLTDLLTPFGFLQEAIGSEAESFLAAAPAAAALPLTSAVAATPADAPASPLPTPDAPAVSQPEPTLARAIAGAASLAPSAREQSAVAATALVVGAAAAPSAGATAAVSAGSGTTAPAAVKAAPVAAATITVKAASAPSAGAAAAVSAGSETAAPTAARVTPLAAATTAATAAPRAPRPPAAPEPRRGVPLWGWLAGLLWAGLLAWWALYPPVPTTAPAVAVTPTPTPTAPSAETTAPRAEAPARLFLSNADGQIAYSGQVGDERTRAAVLDRLAAAFGAANLTGGLEVDPRVGPAPWLEVLGGLLDEMKLPGADLLLEGNSIKVGGWLSDMQRVRLLDALRPHCGEGMAFGFLGDKPTEVVADSAERARTAIAALKPGYGGPELVRALNLWVINFGSDSAELLADSQGLIPPAARAILAAPSDLIVEIAGHTDSTGNAATNQALSEARAAAVRDALIAAGVPPARLTAVGYGSRHPVASDDTPAGRFRNRRIEFVVLE